MIYGIILVFVIATGCTEAYKFQEAKNRRVDNDKADKANVRWHFFKGVMQLDFFALVGLYSTWPIALIGASLFWIFHDLIINIKGLEVTVFRVGTTAWLDRMIRKYGTKFDELEMMIIKVLFLILGITLQIYFYGGL